MYYTRYETIIYPLIAMYNYWQSMYYFSLLSFPGRSFIQNVIDAFISAYSLSYSFSMLTFVIGYPTISLFWDVIMNKLFGYIGINDLFQEKTSSKEILEKIEKFQYSLEHNDTWDAVVMGVSLRTFSVPKPVANINLLNEKCPLRCSGMRNKSESEFLEDCSICLNTINNEKLHRELPCGHVFHPECVDEWLLKNDERCPMCRKTI